MPRVQIQIGPEIHRFEADEVCSVLDQAVSAGVPVNYSCRRGDCGQCIGALTDGEVCAVNPAQALYSDAGIYLCNATARSDIGIELPYFPELATIRQIRSPAKIHALTPLNHDVVELVLRLPPGQDPKILPGQFIRITNKNRTTRSYSLAAVIDDSKLLRLHIRKVEQGAFSAYLFNGAKIGDLLHLEGPQGHFFLRDTDSASKTIFLATGTGIAPIHAILSALTLERRKALGEIDVYWGNRHSRDEYLRDSITHLAERFGFRYHALHSREASGDIRHVQDLMAQHHHDLSAGLVFACGNVAMIETARHGAVRLGLPGERFRSDPFTSS